MSRLAIDNRLTELREFVSRKILIVQDAELQSYLCRLGCVMISGNLERCILLIVMNYCQGKSNEVIQSYVKSQFDRGTNYSHDRIINVLRRFKPEWGRDVEEFFKDGRIREGINSINGLRNQVAHGHNVSIGHNQLLKLLDCHEEVVKKILEIVT